MAAIRAYRILVDALDGALWALFTLILFVLEPFFLHRWFIERARHAPVSTFRLVTRLHWVLLGASLVTVAGAVARSHGYGFGSGR